MTTRRNILLRDNYSLSYDTRINNNNKVHH